MRPKSIVLFDRLYLLALLVGVIQSYLGWDAQLALLRRDPQTAQLGGGFLIGYNAVYLLVALLLWYFVAHRGSVVAKWILTLFTLAGAVSIAVSLTRQGMPGDLPSVLTLVGFGLNAVAVAMLFRSDARPWFHHPEEDFLDDDAVDTADPNRTDGA